MTHYIEAYFEQAQAALGRILRESSAEIERAAAADVIQGSGLYSIPVDGSRKLFQRQKSRLQIVGKNSPARN